MMRSSMFGEFLRGIGSRFLHLAMVGLLFGIAAATQRAAVHWYKLPPLGTGAVLTLSVLALLLTAFVASYSHLSLSVSERHWLRQRMTGLAVLVISTVAVVLGAIVLAGNDWTGERALLDVFACSAASAGVLFAMFCSLANGWSLAQRLVAPDAKVDRWSEVRSRSAA